MEVMTKVELHTLDAVQQPIVLKKVLKGLPPTFADKEVILPDNLSITYVCSHCYNVRNVTVNREDFHNTLDLIDCATCGKKARRKVFGAENIIVLTTPDKKKTLFNLSDFFDEEI